MLQLCPLLIWTFLDDDAYCYKIVQQKLTWHDAKVACEKEEGRLASVHNPGENTFIALKFKKVGLTQGWIGMHDLNEEMAFEWVDSSLADFFFWGTGGKTNYQLSYFNFFIYLSVKFCEQWRIDESSTSCVAYTKNDLYWKDLIVA